MAGSDSEDDAPILGRAKRERTTKSYKIDSGSGSEEDGEEDRPLKHEVKKGAEKKGKAKRAEDESDDGVTDLTGESPKKKAKAPAKTPAKTPAKAEPKVEDGPLEKLDEEEDALLLQIMNQHSSPAKAPAKTPAKPPPSAGRSAAAAASAPASHKRDDGKGAKGEASALTGARAAEKGVAVAEAEDSTLGSARVETSKIKFSRSIELRAPNPKKISHTTFLVQCEDPGLDFEGDSGVIGTLKCSSEKALQLDVKGQVFEGSVLPCNSMMVVELGANEAKIESIFNDFVQLHKIPNPHDDNLEVELSDEEDEDVALEDADDAKGKKGKGKDKAKAKAKGKASKPKKKATKAKKPIASGKKKK